MRYAMAVFAMATLVGGTVAAGDVPSDYPSQLSRSMDAQIESVRRNYEDVMAKAKAKLDAQNWEKEKQRLADVKEKAKRLAAEYKELAQKKLEAVQEKAKERARAEQEEKLAREKAALDLELMKLQVRLARARVELEEAISREAQSRAKDFVDADIEKQKSQKIQ